MITITADYAGRPRPFRHFYGALGYANADFTYTEPTRRMFEYLASYHNHCRYMRVPNILTLHGKGDYYLLSRGSDYGNPPDLTGEFTAGGDTVVSLDREGRPVYDWTTVDRVYDIFVEHGIRAIVETVFIPKCLQTSFGTLVRTGRSRTLGRGHTRLRFTSRRTLRQR